MLRKSIRTGKAVFFGFGLLVAGDTSSAETDPSLQGISCDHLRQALRANQVPAELYQAYCDKAVVATGAVQAIPSAAEAIEAIVSKAPALSDIINRYGPPEKLLALLANTTVEGGGTLATRLNWDLYPELVSYLTSRSPIFYVEERIEDAAPASQAPKRVTTPFWIAFRGQGSSLLRRVLAADALTPYRLEYEPTFRGFPCAAHLYLCVTRSASKAPEDKERLIAMLQSLGVPAPSWSASAGLKELSVLNIRAQPVPNAERCAAGGATDCAAILRLLDQTVVAAGSGRSAFSLSDYAGFDNQGQRHLVTGQAAGEIVAAWISSPAPGGGGSGNSGIELISVKLAGGRIVPHTFHIGKRIEYAGVLRQIGQLVFDAPAARYEIRLSERHYN